MYRGRKDGRTKIIEIVSILRLERIKKGIKSLEKV